MVPTNAGGPHPAPPACCSWLGPIPADAVLKGKLSGKAGQSFVAGKAGKRTVGKNGVMIGVPPFAFTKGNIDQFKF